MPGSHALRGSLWLEPLHYHAERGNEVKGVFLQLQRPAFGARFLRVPPRISAANNSRLLIDTQRPRSIASRMIGATVAFEIPLSLQYFPLSQADNPFCPLLALHPQQQSAMFSLVTILASLMICSQLATFLLDTWAEVNGSRQ